VAEAVGSAPFSDWRLAVSQNTAPCSESCRYRLSIAVADEALRNSAGAPLRALANRQPLTAAQKNSAANFFAAPSFVESASSSYFDTDFLNIRSIFSFVASQHAWLA
jgi:hypothetical protein